MPSSVPSWYRPSPSSLMMAVCLFLNTGGFSQSVYWSDHSSSVQSTYHCVVMCRYVVMSLCRQVSPGVVRCRYVSLCRHVAMRRCVVMSSRVVMSSCVVMLPCCCVVMSLCRHVSLCVVMSPASSVSLCRYVVTVDLFARPPRHRAPVLCV